MSQKQGQTENKIIKENNARGVAQYIKSKACKNIVVMLGAGVSTSAGIPDFRSPETGLYTNLARLRLPYPEAVFEINYFRRNPVPFYTLAQELYPGKFRPTLTHSFMKLLFKHSLLHQCFTQNIDTLELRAGVPPHKVVHAHGSFASQRCIDCGEPYDDDKMKVHIMEKKIAICGECAGLVKPDIVFFGESLPDEFTKSIPNVGMADLLIVIGTSLTVYPFASLAQIPSSQCPRVLINMEKVGDFGSRRNDTVLLGKCDDVVRDLARELGWEDELQQLWEATTLEEAWEDAPTPEQERKQDDTDEKSLQDEVNDLMNKIAKDLTLNENEDRDASQAKEPKNGELEDDKQEKPAEVTLIQGERPSEDIIQKLGL